MLGLRQDGARNDPGMKRNTMGTKMQAKPAPGTSAGKDTAALYFHPTAIYCFYRFYRAKSYRAFLPSRSVWSLFGDSRVEGSQQGQPARRAASPRILAVGFSMLRAADILARHRSRGARLTRG